MKSKLNDILIDPSDQNGKEYLKRNNLTYSKLKNGIQIISSARNMENAASARITFKFLSGAFLNPPGQLHFLEHFINKTIRDTATFNEVDLNVYTSQSKLAESAKWIEIISSTPPAIIISGDLK